MKSPKYDYSAKANARDKQENGPAKTMGSPRYDYSAKSNAKDITGQQESLKKGLGGFPHGLGTTERSNHRRNIVKKHI